MELIKKYFPDISSNQLRQFQQLQPLYNFWNERINLISRSDIHNLYEHHVLHSLAIAKVIDFIPGTRVVDIGTGGGFPGIPLAIMFPDTQFHLIDSIGKKINTAHTIALDLGLMNVKTEQLRAEELDDAYDFMVSRAVAPTIRLFDWTVNHIYSESKNDLPNGMLLLKGGNLIAELEELGNIHYEFPISDFFDEPFFFGKYIIYISM